MKKLEDLAVSDPAQRLLISKSYSNMSLDPIIVRSYKPEWPAQFEKIKEELESDFADYGCKFESIEHIGSTSVPGQTAKPVIDIHVITADEDFNDENKKKFIDAMFNGERRGDYAYKGDGGVGGRWAFKLNGVRPWRNISVVAKGSLVSRANLAVRDTLRKNDALRDKYGMVKKELAKETYYHVNAYSQAKNPIIREILKEAGWTDEEINEKEKNAHPTYPELWPGGKGF